MQAQSIFPPDQRIKLGIWGLGRGQHFIQSCKTLNIDVVAGCDYNAVMREEFQRICPDAFVTDDADAFLARDFDAVLVSTYFMNHCDDTIKALAAGKHVMCEVTSFFTPAEGVRLVEAVERSGKIYHLLENYPFMLANMYLEHLWSQGFFGELQYAEFEYLHECRALQYTFGDCSPVKPGNTAHAWRSWLDMNYYNTHSLGPIMYISKRRPVKVSAMTSTVCLDGYLFRTGSANPQLIEMDNGAVVRNLMGATSSDGHQQRIWGTKAAALQGEAGLTLRLGAKGFALSVKANPAWPAHAELAAAAGHGGGDFWELYFFARECFTGEPGFWDIYRACDVTLAGIQAVRSREQSGMPCEIPDFRDAATRARYRDDHFAQSNPGNPKTIFPPDQDFAITEDFSTVVNNLLDDRIEPNPSTVRKALDGMKIFDDLDAEGQTKVVAAVKLVRDNLAMLQHHYAKARVIADAYPETEPGRVLEELLTSMGEEARVMDGDTLARTLDDFLRRH